MAPSEKSEAEQRLTRLLEIRAIGIAALHEGPGQLNLWDLHTELKSLRIRGRKLEWREAKVALLVAMRERASQVIGSMKTLRALCEEKGVESRFTAFEALVNQSLGDIRLTNHAYRTDNFAEMAHAPIWQQVMGHLEAMTGLGYEAFLNSGTLLGVIRDKRLIDHDDDIDLAVILNAGTAAEAAAEWTALRARLREAGLLDEAAINEPSIHKLLPIQSVQIDLFPAWFEGDSFHLYPHTLGQLGRADVLPLRQCDVTGCPIPAEPEKMLAINYGEGWRAPDPYFKFPWAEAYAQFAPFLGALRP